MSNLKFSNYIHDIFHKIDTPCLMRMIKKALGGSSDSSISYYGNEQKGTLTDSHPLTHPRSREIGEAYKIMFCFYGETPHKKDLILNQSIRYDTIVFELCYVVRQLDPYKEISGENIIVRLCSVHMAQQESGAPTDFLIDIWESDIEAAIFKYVETKKTYYKSCIRKYQNMLDEIG